MEATNDSSENPRMFRCRNGKYARRIVVYRTRDKTRICKLNPRVKAREENYDKFAFKTLSELTTRYSFERWANEMWKDYQYIHMDEVYDVEIYGF